MTEPRFCVTSAWMGAGLALLQVMFTLTFASLPVELSGARAPSLRTTLGGGGGVWAGAGAVDVTSANAGTASAAIPIRCSRVMAGVLPGYRRRYSHSMVPGGFDVTSKATLLTPGTSLMSRLEMRSSTSYGSRAQSAVMASSLVTARMTIG